MNNKNFDYLFAVIKILLFQEGYSIFICFYHWYLYPQLLILKLVLISTECCAVYVEGYIGIFLLFKTGCFRLAETIYILVRSVWIWITPGFFQR